MLFDWLVPALLAVLVVITFWIALRRPPVDAHAERHAREMRDEVARSARATRQELGATLALFQQTLLTQQGGTARTQNEQIDSFSRQLATTQQHLAESLGQATAAQVEQARLRPRLARRGARRAGARQSAALKELADRCASSCRRWCARTTSAWPR